MSFRDDVNPNRLNLGDDDAPKRKDRKSRRLKDPPANLKAAETAALARVRKLKPSPGVILQPRRSGLEGWVTSSPHNDPDLWEVELLDAFGTRSYSLMRTFLAELRRLCSLDWDNQQEDWKTSEREWNAALAFVTEMQPRNAAETAMLAQMVAVHRMIMRLSEAQLRNGYVDEKSAAKISKLARTYADQLETLNSIRGGKKPTRQTIIVKRETHVHYHDNRGRGGAENRAQPHQTDKDGGTLIVQECAPVPGHGEADREAVPVPGGPGAPRLSGPRGARGCAKGQGER